MNLRPIGLELVERNGELLAVRLGWPDSVLEDCPCLRSCIRGGGRHCRASGSTSLS
jgi:hypothetical protein